MREAITTVRNGDTKKVLEGPNTDVTGQRARFKAIVARESESPSPAFDEIQLWTSSQGMVKRKRFSRDTAPAPAVEPPPEAATPPTEPPSAAQKPAKQAKAAAKAK